MMRFITPWTKEEKRFPFDGEYVLRDEFIGENINLKLINSKTYKKLAPFLAIGFLVTYLLSFVFLFPTPVIIGLVALNVLIPIVVIIFSKNYKEKGRLSIDIRHLIVVQNEKPALIVPIAQLNDLKISRKSTVHLENKGPYPSETNDNWISFTFNNQYYKLEFCIGNKEESHAFDLIIYRLKGVYPMFRFESV